MKNRKLWHVTLILLSFYGVRYADSDTIQLNHTRIDDGTTTALPIFNKTTRLATITVTTPTTLTSSVTPVTEKSTTPGTTPTGTSYTTRNNKYSSTNAGGLSTTTAMPLGTSSAIVERQFDTLSFMGGCLFTVSIITVGLFIWKMYEARIERRYLTI